MGRDELADFEARTFKQWDRASLSALRIDDRPEAKGAGAMTVPWYRIKKTYEKPQGGFLAERRDRSIDQLDESR